MEYVLSKFAIKHGKTAETKAFLQELNEHHQSDMREVLEEAEMFLDCSFVVSENDGDYVFIFKKIADHNKLIERISDSKLKVYEKIRAWGESCLELDSRERFSPIAHFDRT